MAHHQTTRATKLVELAISARVTASARIPVAGRGSRVINSSQSTQPSSAHRPMTTNPAIHFVDVDRLEADLTPRHESSCRYEDVGDGMKKFRIGIAIFP